MAEQICIAIDGPASSGKGTVARTVAKALGFTTEQVETGLLTPRVGNTYSGAVFLGLAAVFDVAKPGDMLERQFNHLANPAEVATARRAELPAGRLGATGGRSPERSGHQRLRGLSGSPQFFFTARG